MLIWQWQTKKKKTKPKSTRSNISWIKETAVQMYTILFLPFTAFLLIQAKSKIIMVNSVNIIESLLFLHTFLMIFTIQSQMPVNIQTAANTKQNPLAKSSLGDFFNNFCYALKAPWIRATMRWEQDLGMGLPCTRFIFDSACQKARSEK